MKNYAFNRRAVLGSLGLGGASLFLPSLMGSRSQAAGAVPKRLVICYTGHGTYYPNWIMRKGAPSADKDIPTDWDVPLGSLAQSDFSPCLAPYYDLRSDLTVVDGLYMHTAYTQPGDVNGHQTGVMCSLTGGQMTNSTTNTTSHPSFDQLAGKAISAPTQIPTVEMTVDQQDQGYGGPIRDASGKIIEPENSLQTIYNRLFSNLPSSGTTPVTPAAPTDAQLLANAEKSMLAFAQGEYSTLNTKLSSEDRVKLEAHRSLMQDLQNRLGGTGAGGGGGSGGTVIPPVTCDQKPAFPSGVGDGLKAHTLNFSTVIAQALHCDITRVITLQIPGPSLAEIGMPGDDFHQQYAHQCDNGTPQHGFGVPGGGDPTLTAQAQVGATKFHAFNAGLIADLGNLLKGLPESDGSTLLDNTAVVWCSELAAGCHDYAVWPVVILGGSKMGLNTGRYIYYGQKYTNTAPNAPSPAGAGPGHNRLWVSLGRALGMSGLNQVGLASAKGTLHPGTVDLTGPLDRLLLG